jgi:hypothetical protein
MSKIVFIQFGDTRQLELKIDGDSTWMTVAEEFLSFLQGCGYQVTGADLMEYYTEVYGTTDYEPADDLNFAFTDDQFNLDEGTVGDVDITLDDVMYMWGRQPEIEPVNTITISTT